MLWYGMVWYGMVWYGMVWYGMVWYGMVWYGMVWYGMPLDGGGQGGGGGAQSTCHCHVPIEPGHEPVQEFRGENQGFFAGHDPARWSVRTFSNPQWVESGRVGSEGVPILTGRIRRYSISMGRVGSP